jgi:hypothetical protein
VSRNISLLQNTLVYILNANGSMNHTSYYLKGLKMSEIIISRILSNFLMLDADFNWSKTKFGIIYQNQNACFGI